MLYDFLGGVLGLLPVVFPILGGRFGYLLFFFCLGVSGGDSRKQSPRRRGGGKIFLENPRGGGLWTGGGGEGLGGCLRGFFGGGG